MDVAPRGEHDDRREKGRQQDEKEAHAVHPEVVLDPPGGDPRHALDQLELGLAGAEAGEHPERERERDEREDERGAPHAGERLAGEERQEDRAHERREDEQREQRHRRHQRPT